MPLGTPIPPSPDTSNAILDAFAERGIRFVKDSLVKALDPGRKVAVLVAEKARFGSSRLERWFGEPRATRA